MIGTTGLGPGEQESKGDGNLTDPAVRRRLELRAQRPGAGQDSNARQLDMASQFMKQFQSHDCI